MSHFDHRQFEGAFDSIERTILPSLGRVLDGLLDAAVLARPGHDADTYAAGLRATARQMDELTRLLETAATR